MNRQRWLAPVTAFPSGTIDRFSLIRSTQGACFEIRLSERRAIRRCFVVFRKPYLCPKVHSYGEKGPLENDFSSPHGHRSAEVPGRDGLNNEPCRNFPRDGELFWEGHWRREWNYNPTLSRPDLLTEEVFKDRTIGQNGHHGLETSAEILRSIGRWWQIALWP